MIRRPSLILAAAAIACIALAARCDVSVTLRAVARLAPNSPITLGDIADVSGGEGLASTPLAALSPERAGSSVLIGVAEVESALRAAGADLARIRVGGAVCRVIARAPATVTLDATPAPAHEPVHEPSTAVTLRDHILFRVAQVLGRDRATLDLQFEDRDEQLLATPAAGRTIDVHTPGISRRTPVVMTIYQADGTITEHRLRAAVRVRVEAARAGRVMPRGATVEWADVTREQVWIAPDSPIVEADAAIGLRLKRGVKAGDLLSRGVIESDTVIERGDIVAVHVASGTVVVRREARAISAGRVGEAIELEPLTGDGGPFHATVEAPGRAVIITGSESAG
jgi:flagella basal body P-ring formation protein FlgA